jgi:CRISPR-associated endonuclease/helicase Cas3
VGSSGVSNNLKNSLNYLAHSPGETLDEHMKLVGDYFLRLTDIHGLETQIEKLLIEWSGNDAEVCLFAKTLFWEAIFYHDFGKVNENFQNRLGNPLFGQKVNNDIDQQHAILSAFIFFVHQFSKIKNSSFGNRQEKLISLVIALGLNITRHHAARLDDLSEKVTFKKLANLPIEKLKPYLNCYSINYDAQVIPSLKNISAKPFCGNPDELLLLLTRLNFSLLTAADYYATSHYFNKWEGAYNSFGVLTNTEKTKIYYSLKSTQKHNAALYLKPDYFQQINEKELTVKCPDNLNLLRSKMASEIVCNIRRYAGANLFYIEAPTGGGKTNLSMIAACELLNLNPELNKVFYVFPFTTLITQTAKSVKETLDLSEEQIVELHSKAGYKEIENSEELEDGLYGASRIDHIDNLFVNYPVVLLSHIRFFDILKANQKDSIYLMHRLANSIVIIDEVQAYNPMLWDKTAYLLKIYAAALNIKFVVMSATLPKLGDLTDSNFIHLIPDSINRFFVNPNFSKRVHFDNSLKSVYNPAGDERDDFLRLLTNTIYEKCEAYCFKHGNVRAIVEFIFKKSATSFAQTVREMFAAYEIRVLSGTILEPARKEIINFLKSDQSKGKNILLVTTQVVEAGVDIDMDLGFKNQSIIDSEEQLAGRVNRNVSKEDNVVYLFDLDDASLIYGNDLRYKKSGKLNDDEYLRLLESKRFDEVYDLVKEHLVQSNSNMHEGGNLTAYQRAFMRLNFPEIDYQYQLIENQSVTVFVPLKLPITIIGADGKPEAVFSQSQLSFLRSNNIKFNEKIPGGDVFELYRNLVHQREGDFISEKKNLKILQGIMCNN